MMSGLDTTKGKKMPLMPGPRLPATKEEGTARLCCCSALGRAREKGKAVAGYGGLRPERPMSEEGERVGQREAKAGRHYRWATRKGVRPSGLPREGGPKTRKDDRERRNPFSFFFQAFSNLFSNLFELV